MTALVVLRIIGWRLAAAVAITAAAIAVVAAEPASESQLQNFLGRALENHIRPVHGEFAERTGALLTATTALCANPGPEAREAVEAAFRNAVVAASALETVRVGPISSDNRRERIDFWPDPRGRGLAQVQKVLAAEDPRDLDVTVLAAKSVAVQGLPAFEFLLYGSGSEAIVEAGSFRCAFARTIAENLSDMGAAMADGWKGDDGAAALLLAPGPTNPLFRDTSEAAGQLVGDMATAMEILADQKLKAILGDGPEKSKPKLAPWWRSGNSFAAFAATVEATRHLFDAADTAALLGPADKWIAVNANFQARNAVRVIGKLDPDVAATLDDPKGREDLGYVRLVTRDLRTLLGTELPAAVGLARGFNSLDGD